MQLRFLAIAIVGMMCTAASAWASAPKEDARAFLTTYCVTCHNAQARTGGLVLEGLDVDNVTASAETWEKVRRRLRAVTMPPRGMPKPDAAARAAVVSWIERSIDAVYERSPKVGPRAVRRVNQTHYANAVRDLLGLDVDARSLLPADDTSYGFDNIAGVLTVSPTHMASYLSAARKIAALAVGDVGMKPTTAIYRVSPLLTQDVRMDEALPFGSRGGTAIRHYFPLDGEYVLRISFQHVYAAGGVRGLQDESQVDVRLDGTRIRTVTVGGQPRARGAGADLEVRFAAKAGERVLSVIFRRNSHAVEGAGPKRFPVANISYLSDPEGLLAVDFVHIMGPYGATSRGNAAPRRQIFVCQPSSPAEAEPCAKRILSRLARLAYRRPVTPDDVDVLMGFFRTSAGKAGFDAGITAAIERLLVAPEFIFRFERVQSGAAGRLARLTDLELASSLSFFLWSSIPDDALLEVAEAGRLREPGLLGEQATRMLRDPRSDALVHDFAGQWLNLRKLAGIAPDPKLFPEFDDNLRAAFLTETEFFLLSQLRENRSVLELLTTNYTYLNERLARHYQVPHVVGNHFRRVESPEGRRAGLLGHGSVLVTTSHPTRTSPVLRGKWILDNLLAAPPPAPPPNVPELEATKLEGTLRERMEQHRQNPTCANCHSQMDPLGFALENFDAVGKWRDRDGVDPIDASGVMPDGSTFDTLDEFTAVLTTRKEAFVEAIVEKLLTYALGRGVEFYDMPAVRKIVKDARQTNYRWSTILLGIVESQPFQMRGTTGDYH